MSATDASPIAFDVFPMHGPLSIAPPLELAVVSAVIPPVPECLEDTGISLALIEQLVMKLLYFRGEVMGKTLAMLLGLPYSLIDELLENLKRQHHVGVRKSLGTGNSSGAFALTESGRSLAREHMENNLYAGPVPVPLYQYTEVVRRQRLGENWLKPQALRRVFEHLVVEQDVLERIGPAVNANQSFLIYGQPGNGKTALAEALLHLETEPIYMPYAIESQGNIVQLYDPIHHHKIDDSELDDSVVAFDPGFDRRWFKCRRPFIITGGELSLDMLDLSLNKVSKVYNAPFQLKANNGIYLIDDFGRQKASPIEILNRWIVPMEKRVDYLSFQAGGKMTVPFEAFLIFSSNLRPDQLGDEAFLRRIQYKMFLRSPGRNEFVQIFERFANSRLLDCEPGVLDAFVNKHYVQGGKRYRRCHPRDVITHAVDIINFRSLPKKLTGDLLDQAFDGCFADNFDVND